MNNIIWSNDADQLDAVIGMWTADARAKAADMAADPGRTLADAYHGEGLILETAWHALPAGTAPTAASLAEAIDGIDPMRCPTAIVQAATDLIGEYRWDEIANLSTLSLDRPVAILGLADLWDGQRTLHGTVRFDTVGDILRQAPWTGMDADCWSIDERDDLRYTGIHHDGVNTCTYRTIRKGARLSANPTLQELNRNTEPLGPAIRNLYGMPRTQER